MFEPKKTLIVVYKDELLMNQLKKMIETHDDSEEIVGTKDDSVNVVSWTEKVWLGNKKAGNIQGKILFLGDIKGTDKLIPVIDKKFDDYGVKYGWAGNQAVLYEDVDVLTNRDKYDQFLKKFDNLPVPEFLKTVKNKIVESVEEEMIDEEENVQDENESKKPNIFRGVKKIVDAGVDKIGTFGKQVSSKVEEIFRDKSLVKRQMLFYGVIKLYKDGLKDFMKQ